MSADTKAFTWESSVQDSELDVQKIVNNAVYMQYLDKTRVQHLKSLGIGWKEWHENGFNLVLAHADLHYKAPLVANDEFYVTSKLSKNGKLKIIFHQDIFRKADNKCVLSAINTVVCVDIKSGKPTMPNELSEKLLQ